MKRINFCFVILPGFVSFLKLHAQQEIPFLNSFDYVNEPCPWNDTVNINTVSGWYAYHTLDDTYNGTVDSNYCISLKYDSSYFGLSFHINNIDTTRALFIKANITDSNKISLLPNYAYRYSVEFLNNLLNVSFSTDCSESFCSGVIISTQIPDSTYTSFTKRWYYFSAEEIYNNWDIICLPTEKFEEQYLSDFIYKVSFNSAETLDTIKNGSETYSEQVFTVQYSDSLSSSGSYDIDGYFNIYFTGYYDPILFVHNNPCYPSTSCIDSLIVTPIPNPDEPVDIYLHVGFENAILIQPFVNLVGAYAEGDTTRHTVSIVNDGGSICLNIVELPFDKGEQYYHKTGNLQFASETGCMLFKESSSLHIAKNSTLDYGKYGIGALGLMSGCNILLDSNASLIIGNSVLLLGTEYKQQSIYLNINEGSTLRFNKGSNLKRWNAYAGNMQLVVYMNGGILDDSGLSDHDKQYIRRIYPAEENALLDKITIYPNPVNDNVTLEIQNETETSAIVSLLDMNGKVLKTETRALNSGLTPVYFDMADIERGFYIFQIVIDAEVAVKKIIKL